MTNYGQIGYRVMAQHTIADETVLKIETDNIDDALASIKEENSFTDADGTVHAKNVSLQQDETKGNEYIVKIS